MRLLGVGKLIKRIKKYIIKRKKLNIIKQERKIKKCKCGGEFYLSNSYNDGYVIDDYYVCNQCRKKKCLSSHLQENFTNDSILGPLEFCVRNTKIYSIIKCPICNNDLVENIHIPSYLKDFSCSNGCYYLEFEYIVIYVKIFDKCYSLFASSNERFEKEEKILNEIKFLKENDRYLIKILER